MPPALAMAVLAGCAAGLAAQQQDTQPAGAVPGITASLADLMALTPVSGTAQAPDFSLTDQSGRAMSLSGFRGRVVVLQFMDPHCTDICPIVSAEFLRAYRELGKAADRAAFVAVNVNPYHRQVADMAACTRQTRLSAIPQWHFLTGTVASLQAVWHRYGIQVIAPGPDADVQHTSVVYFIDPNGRERYVASPEADHTAGGTSYLPAGQLAAWGHGIALVTRHLAG